MKQAIIIKYSEIALKKGNRSLFEKQLARNIAKATGIPYKGVERKSGRFYLYPNDNEITSVMKNLPYVFGLHAFTNTIKMTYDIEKIKDETNKLIVEAGKITTFGIRPKRINKKIPLNSNEIGQVIGQSVLEQHPHLKVNLKNPDVMITIEIRDEGVFIYSSRNERSGPGGFPINTSGRGLLLLSGGIDSPVAGWSVMKRGMIIDGVYFDSSPYTSEKAKEKVLDLSRVLAKWKQGPVRVIIPSLTEIQRVIAKKAPEHSWTILIRRSMVRIASAIAKKDNYQALITGENLAQVASQTLDNIATINQTTDLLTLRPLLTYDKMEIVELAKNIGTYDISIRPYEDCCTLFTPKKPKTKSRPGPLSKIEEDLQLSELEHQSIESTEEHVIYY